MSKDIKIPKKLIEVALPLDDINEAAGKEKSIRQGHPSSLHLWWARRPLSAARAVIFAQMVNDPGYQQGGGFKFGINKEKAAIEREKLFDIVRDLVKWENTNNEDVLSRAREAIHKSWRETCELNKGHPKKAELFDPDSLPAFHDPFAGGGALPLEAQRLGLEAYASDLNPIAVVINKAMIEIPPKFTKQSPIGPIPSSEKQQKLVQEWPGASGLAEDLRRYGYWLRNEAESQIGHLYPKVKITNDMLLERPDLEPYKGQVFTVLSWIWVRTVKSPNPMFSNVDVPLASSFILSKKKGKEAWIEPIVSENDYRFKVRVGAIPVEAKTGTKVGRGGNFKCLMSGASIPVSTVREQGQSGTFSQKLMAVVLEGKPGRIYLSPTPQIEEIALSANSDWRPSAKINYNPRDIRPQLYGLTEYADLFTPRQLTALNTFSDLVHKARDKAVSDAISAGMPDDNRRLEAGGSGAKAYGDAVATLLAFSIDKMADLGNNLVRWEPIAQCPRQLFGRQAIPMVWDFAEANPFSSSSGSWMTFVEGQSKAYAKSFQNTQAWFKGHAEQADAACQILSENKLISTDPPYYDNIAYADLSDFFYVWMRKVLRDVFPTLFGTMAVPKSEELVATPYRHGDKEAADLFFLDGMTKAIHNMSTKGHPAFPTTIYYAFKQSETGTTGTSSTGWETFLEAVINAGFSILGTWPLRTENASRMVGQGTNALASSVVLVCQRRNERNASISRRQFQRQLREDMPEALEAMIGGSQGSSPIAPVDLAQAAIGPGMGIFSQYESVLNQDGSAMSVHDALILINRAITDYLNPDTGSFDNDTLFSDSWFAEYGWSTGPFGQADTLARAKGTTVDGVKEAGVIESGQGKVRLLKWQEYPTDWDPKQDNRTPIWEAVHHLIRAINQQGESGAGALLSRMPERGESIRQLAYHLYTLCERKGWAEDARAYNELISAWHAIVAASHDIGHVGSQTELEI